jgi:hypothetical protein
MNDKKLFGKKPAGIKRLIKEEFSLNIGQLNENYL